MAIFPGTLEWGPETSPDGTPTTLEPHNFVSRPPIEVRSKAKL
jgi:hypothetical protein